MANAGPNGPGGGLAKSAADHATGGRASASRRSRDPEDRWGRAMALAQAGDEAAYRRLLEELLPVVRRHVRAKIADAGDTEDVVQNALISIHRGRRTYRPEQPFAPWMRTIVRHCVIDWLRERGRRLGREVAVASPELFAGPSEPGDASSSELSAPLVEALQELPASQREAVELIHVQGLSVAEAALRAGVSPGALKVRAHRGYRALRARLQKTDWLQGVRG